LKRYLQRRRLIVSDEAPLAPYIYEGLDPVSARRSTGSALSESLKDVLGVVSCAIDAARKPGMPLGILSSITREAPLGSLMVAFVLGVVVARRRAR
jgi:hypothetical protein